MSHFHDLKKTQSPPDLFAEIPAERHLVYSLRNPRIYDQGTARTNRFSNLYFHNTLCEWSLLNDDIQNSSTINEFKNRLLKITRHVKDSVHDVFEISSIRRLTKLRLEFNDVNAHRFWHNLITLSFLPL